MRKGIMAVLVPALALGAMPAVADVANGGYGYHPMMGWGGWFMGPVMLLLFVAILIGGLVVAARLLGWHPAGGGAAASDRALSILRERFARGEIDQAEYEARRRTLE